MAAANGSARRGIGVGHITVATEAMADARIAVAKQADWQFPKPS